MEFVEKINNFSKHGIPFITICDFSMDECIVCELGDAQKKGIFFEFGCLEGYEKGLSIKKAKLLKEPPPFDEYRKKFDFIIDEIKNGNVYLLNLCCKSEIKTDLSLEEIYRYAKAPFKLYLKDRFVSFTPEPFVSIKGDRITTNPMKGTINANIKNAKELLLGSEKELAEHVMIVDLLRNDLGRVARGIKVDEFRYVERVNDILQSSSKISGKLNMPLKGNLGDILAALLPAGSISGTPKISALNIIKKVEGFERGFFSGVCGVYDGEEFRSFVLIRFVEQEGDKLYYKSGGGITLDSDVLGEYNEMCEKIYFPI